MTNPPPPPARHPLSQITTATLLATTILTSLISSACRHTPGEASNPVAHKVSDPRWHLGMYDPGSPNFRMGIR